MTLAQRIASMDDKLLQAVDKELTEKMIAGTLDKDGFTVSIAVLNELLIRDIKSYEEILEEQGVEI